MTVELERYQLTGSNRSASRFMTATFRNRGRAGWFTAWAEIVGIENASYPQTKASFQLPWKLGARQWLEREGKAELLLAEYYVENIQEDKRCHALLHSTVQGTTKHRFNDPTCIWTLRYIVTRENFWTRLLPAWCHVGRQHEIEIAPLYDPKTDPFLKEGR